EAAAVGDAVDRGDRRLVDGDVAAELRQEVRRRDLQRGARHLGQVAAGAERIVAGAGEHEHRGGVVVVEPPDAVPEPGAHRGRQRVARLRPVDGQPGDPVLHLVGDAHGSATTASTCPVSTAWPTVACREVTVPSCGARTACSIFIASRTTTTVPAVTDAPSATSTRTTVPGIGACSEPASSSATGSGNRTASTSSVAPSALSQNAVSPTRCTSTVRRTPATVSVTRSGVTSPTETSNRWPSTLARTPSRPNR